MCDPSPCSQGLAAISTRKAIVAIGDAITKQFMDHRLTVLFAEGVSDWDQADRLTGNVQDEASAASSPGRQQKEVMHFSSEAIRLVQELLNTDTDKG